MSVEDKLKELLDTYGILALGDNFLVSTIKDGEKVIVCSKSADEREIIGYNNLSNLCSNEVITSEVIALYDEMTNNISKGGMTR